MPAGTKSDHLKLLSALSDAGVQESMLHHWLHNAYPEISKVRSWQIVQYWLVVTRGEKRRDKKNSGHI